MVKAAAVVHEEQHLILSSLSPDRAQKRLALAVVLGLVIAFSITAGPLSTIHLGRIDAFIPAYATAMFVVDSITAVLLFAQFSILRSRALLAIASGYLFTALIAIPWMLTFPGVFTPGGLLGAGLQSTHWLYILWHAGFPMFVIAYALWKDADPDKRVWRGSTGAAIFLSVAMVAAVVCAATFLVTAGEALLPRIALDSVHFTGFWFYAAGSMVLLSVLALWVRRRSVLDLWLMVVMCAYVIEICLSAFPVPARFSVGWYAGRVCGLLSGSLVLFVLLYEITKLYAQLLRAVFARRELLAILDKKNQTLEAANRAAEAANWAKSAFLANMSHELRTPLNAILGYAQILKRDDDLSDKRAGGLNTIYQSGEHLLALIDDVLDLSKIEAGKLELYPNAFNLLSFLEVIGDIIRIKAEQKDLVFHLDALAPLPAVRADERRLRQVLLNLLGNAVKFTDRGEVCLRVQELARSATQVRLRFEVTDTGIGIRPEDRETIFKPFEQVGDIQRRAAGTGLGLTLSRQLICMMDGALEVESQVGRGSRFTFDLALALAAEEPAVRPVPRAVKGYRGPRRRLLVVDDVLPNRTMLVDLLSPLGFSIDEAADGQAALNQAQAMVPDLILMDMVMPAMDGLEAIRQLRQLEGFRATPIIAVSASVSGPDQARGVAAGANVFLSKPIEPDQLLQQIGALLDLTWDYAQAEAVGDEPLVAPPDAELEALHALALAGNMRDIVHWAEQLARKGQPYLPFADKLRRLAEGYQSKAILALVEQHLMRGLPCRSLSDSC